MSKKRGKGEREKAEQRRKEGDIDLFRYKLANTNEKRSKLTPKGSHS
jgi:hypothetical protein